MSFENLISNLSDQKVIKAISKPIPKKIISCIGEDSFTASEIADKISFPKEKIYYHIKKLVAFKILTVSETNEIKGIIQKKYRLAEISSPFKKESLHDDGHENDLYINEKLKTKIIETETASKFEYVKAIANKMMGNSSSSEIVIQKYQTNSKIKKLSSVIFNTRKDINSVKEKIESIIAQISLYNDSDQLYANQKRLIQENEQFSKRIDSYKKDIALSNDKISIIKKNYNDEKIKQNITIKELLTKIEKTEKELLIQSNKKDQIESYIKNIYDEDSILKNYEKFNFKNDLSVLNIKKKDLKEEIANIKSQIILRDEKITQIQKAIELIAAQTVSYDNDLNNLLHQTKLFGPSADKVLNNNELLEKNLENELLDLNNRKKEVDDKLISLDESIRSNQKQISTISKSIKPDHKELKSLRAKQEKLLKKQSIISSDIDSINQNKKQLVNAHKDKIDETFDLLKEIEIVIKKNEASKLSEQLKTLAQKKKSLNFKKGLLEKSISSLQEELYQDQSFVENSKTLFQKEYKKELSKYDSIKGKIKKSEDTVLVITSEIEVLKSLIDFHKAVLESLRLFESDTFKINFDSKAIEKNNEDRSLEIILDGYIKTYNWSAAQLKKASSNFNKNKFIKNLDDDDILKESKIVIDISSSLLSIPQKLEELNLKLIETRKSSISYLKKQNIFQSCKEEIKTLNKKKSDLKKNERQLVYQIRSCEKSIKVLNKEKLKNEELLENIQTSISKLKEKSKLLKNNKIDYDFKHVDEIKNIDKKIINVEAANEVLIESLKEQKVINQKREKKLKIFEKLIHSIEKESDKIDSVNHKIKLIEFEDKNISEQKSAAIQKIRQDIDNYESSIIKKKSWISSSRFEENQILGEIRLWKKELNRLNAEKKLINNEIEKSQQVTIQKEEDATSRRDQVINKIRNEMDKEYDQEIIKQSKLKKIYLDNRSKILDEENKIITVIKIKEKNLLDLQKKISKVVEKIQKFKLTKKRELDKFERQINQYKVSKEKISSRQITFNQQLNVELSLCKDVEVKLKDKILEAASEVKAIEDKISFKSGSTYATFMKQTIDIDESQASVLVSDSILNHQNSISLIKKDLRVEKQELSKNISNHKKDIKKIRSKISLAKKDIFTLNKKISATEKSQRKFNLPLSKLIQSQELLVKEKDLAEKSFISLQVKEQENLDALVQKRTALEDEYNKNANKLDKIYKAKLNELKNRIKNQEDLRLMKINQNSRNLKKVLEKTDQRMNRIDQLIATGEEVIRESYLAIDEITKKRSQLGSAIKVYDKKIFMLDNKLEKTKYGLKMKMESNIKKLDNLKNQIENSETNKLNLGKDKNVIELELKSFDNKSINLGRDSSQIEFDISQNKKMVEDLKQRKIKLNKDKSINDNYTEHSEKELYDSLNNLEKMFENTREDYSGLISELNTLDKNKAVLEKDAKMSRLILSNTEKEILEKLSDFDSFSKKLQSARNSHTQNFSLTKKMLKSLQKEYQLLFSSSKKIKENKKLVLSYTDTLINDKNKTSELYNIRYKEGESRAETLKKMNENFHILERESEQKNKQFHIKKDVNENELKNILKELDDNDNKIFELKTLKKSETHQLKIYKDRKSSLVKKIDTLNREHKKDVPVIDDLLSKKEKTLSNVDSNLERCSNRIDTLEKSLLPRKKELGMIEDRNKNDFLDLEDLKIEKKNVDSKINNSIGAIRKIKKTIKHDTKKINSEKIKNENSIQNLKLNLEQNNKSAESLRKDLENSIQIKGSLTNELKSQIKEKDKIKDKIGTVKNRLDSSKDLKKLMMEHKSLEKEVKNMNLKLNQFHENFSALSAGLNELKQINQENIAPIEKNILDKEYEVLKDIDGMKENEKAIKDYTLRIKQAPSKLKSLDIQYKDQNRTKFKLELKLKESIRSLEMLKKRSEMFDSSMM